MDMSEAAHRPLRYDEYLQIEQDTGIKHEYLDGRATAMAGGTSEHSHLAGQLLAHLVVALRGGPRRPFNSDFKMRVEATGLSTYPDLSVICGQIERPADDRNAALNPRVLVEVLSPSTERYDRGEKWAHYEMIPSLREYVLVSSDRERVEVFSRENGWVFRSYGPGERISLPSLGLEIPLDELYSGWTEVRDLRS